MVIFMVYCTSGTKLAKFLDIETIVRKHHPESELHVQLHETAKVIKDMKTRHVDTG